MSGQSQKHGFTFENNIRENVFNLPKEKNDTKTHDIPKKKNKFNSNENCSIKTTGSDIICCGDILRFFNYDFNEKNTIIVIAYKQTDTHKIIENIYEIDYNKKCHEVLFGDLPKEEIIKYVEGVKSIPRKTKGEEAKNIYNYLFEKKKLKSKYNYIIQINPKVDSSQSRVQCSIPKFEKNICDFITYKSSDNTPNILRNKEIIYSIESCRRKRKTKNNKHKKIKNVILNIIK